MKLATEFVKHLTANERNALRHLLLTETGLQALKAGLGAQRIAVTSDHTYKTSHAVRGTGSQCR